MFGPVSGSIVTRANRVLVPTVMRKVPQVLGAHNSLLSPQTRSFGLWDNAKTLYRNVQQQRDMAEGKIKPESINALFSLIANYKNITFREYVDCVLKISNMNNTDWKTQFNGLDPYSKEREALAEVAVADVLSPNELVEPLLCDEIRKKEISEELKISLARVKSVFQGFENIRYVSHALYERKLAGKRLPVDEFELSFLQLEWSESRQRESKTNIRTRQREWKRFIRKL